MDVSSCTCRFPFARLCTNISGREVNICASYWEVVGSLSPQILSNQFPCNRSIKEILGYRRKVGHDPFHSYSPFITNLLFEAYI
jgi:hypothetical protein